MPRRMSVWPVAIQTLTPLGIGSSRLKTQAPAEVPRRQHPGQRERDSAAKLNLDYSDSRALRSRRRRRLRCARRGRSRRKGDLHRNKRRHGIPAQPVLARNLRHVNIGSQTTRCAGPLLRPIVARHSSRQRSAAFLPMSTASSARRDNFQSGDLRISVWSVIRLCLHPPSHRARRPSPERYKAAAAGAHCRGAPIPRPDT